VAVTLRPPLASSKTKKQRHNDPIPAALGEAVDAFATTLKAKHSPAFRANPRLKYRVSRLLASKLPPCARRPGRPGFPEVTTAIRLRRKLRRSEPNPRKLWTKICTIVFPGYALLPKSEQKEVRAQLRQRTHWRLAARSRRRHRIRGGICVRELSVF
jgi:hypothetical protein